MSLNLTELKKLSKQLSDVAAKSNKLTNTIEVEMNELLKLMDELSKSKFIISTFC